MYIPAIPTTYKGVNFRSKLEARWAAFFDLCGWRWEYEPEELKGWIPDFVLLGNDPAGVLVEVKPIRDLGEDGGRDAVRKYEATGDRRECLILGVGPTKYNSDGAFIGWLCERDLGEGGDTAWARAECGLWEASIGFCHEEQSYDDRIGGGYDGCGVRGGWSDVQLLWIQAGNATQWKPSGASRRG